MLLRVVDLETLGLAPTAQVCEIGWTDVRSSGMDLAGRPTDWRVADTFTSLLVNPGEPIPPETSAIHHIVDEDVAGALTFDEALSRLRNPSVDAYVAHSAKFERLWLTDQAVGPVPWICTYKCSLRIWPDSPSHSNQALRYWRRQLGLDRAVANVAHRAGPDAYVTAFHVRDLLASATVEELIEWSSQPALQVRCHIGSWRGQPWREVDDGFLYWVSQRDFDEDVLFTVETEMRRRREEREAEERALGTDRGPSQEDAYVPF